jgi:hypothetical protein
MSTTTPGAQIERTVTDWPGVSAEPHRFGGREYRVGGREFGHTHGDRQADVPFPSALRNVLVREGRTSEHHLYPDSGWVTFYLDEDGTAEDALTLLKLSYLWHTAALQKRGEPTVEGVDVAAELAALSQSPDVERVFERVLG